MFTKSAAFYDAIYAAAGKDYEREAQRAHTLIQRHRPETTRLTLLGCGQKFR